MPEDNRFEAEEVKTEALVLASSIAGRIRESLKVDPEKYLHVRIVKGRVQRKIQQKSSDLEIIADVGAEDIGHLNVGMLDGVKTNQDSFEVVEDLNGIVPAFKRTNPRFVHQLKTLLNNSDHEGFSEAIGSHVNRVDPMTIDAFITDLTALRMPPKDFLKVVNTSLRKMGVKNPVAFMQEHMSALTKPHDAYLDPAKLFTNPRDREAVEADVTIRAKNLARILKKLAKDRYVEEKDMKFIVECLQIIGSINEHFDIKGKIAKRHEKQDVGRMLKTLLARPEWFKFGGDR